MDFNFDFGSMQIDQVDFSGFDIDINAAFETRYIKPPKTKEIAEVNLKYADAIKLAKDIDITTDTRYFVVLNGSFYFGDFIEALITEKNYHVKKMTISTLSMNENNVDSLANLLNGGYIDELNLIVSDYFFSHERQNLIPYIYKELDKPTHATPATGAKQTSTTATPGQTANNLPSNKFQLAAAATHCKICIFETYCGKFVVIHGSANLRTSGNIEQMVIEESLELYNFTNEYQDAIIEKYKTINKSVRDSTLWKTINK